jgi:antitoxin component YwqK of YwqJK toxin-antitoxin module
MRTIIFFSTLILFICSNTSGQTNCNNVNQLNNEGKKVGLWIEDKDLTYVYYKNGLRNGLYIHYNQKNGKVHRIGEYREGLHTGKWFYFNEEGFLLFTEENIKQNVNISRIRDDGVKIIPKYTSYVIDYYRNGVVKEEGQVLYSEDIQVDYYKTGIWKYYNEEGELIEEKQH